MNSPNLVRYHRIHCLQRILGVLALGTVAPGLAAQSSPPPTDAKAKPAAATAWTQLRSTLKQSLEAGNDPEKAIGRALLDLQQFADEYKGSEEAVAALFNHGMLALNLGQDELAERSLKKAASTTSTGSTSSVSVSTRTRRPSPDF